MKRSGPLKRKTPLKARKQYMRNTRAPKRKNGQPKKKPPNGFHEKIKLEVARRSGGRCEAGLECCQGGASHFHHRKLRRHKDHRVVAALHVCSRCHTYIHDHPAFSYMMGYLVHGWAEPGEIPVKPGSRYHEIRR